MSSNKCCTYSCNLSNPNTDTINTSSITIWDDVFVYTSQDEEKGRFLELKGKGYRTGIQCLRCRGRAVRAVQAYHWSVAINKLAVYTNLPFPMRVWT